MYKNMSETKQNNPGLRYLFESLKEFTAKGVCKIISYKRTNESGSLFSFVCSLSLQQFLVQENND